MKTVEINEKEYTVEKNYKDALDIEAVVEKYTEYFDEYDYIFGDYSYGKLRLKGFNESKNKKSNEINDIKGLDKYIKDYCSHECAYFLLKKTNK